MRSTQFWVLLMASIIVAGLYLKEIALSRSIRHQQTELVDDTETADTATIYEKGWEQLAFNIYQSSRQDPAMLDFLKSENIQVHQGAPPGTVGAGTAPVAPALPGPSTKSLANPTTGAGHPATP